MLDLSQGDLIRFKLPAGVWSLALSSDGTRCYGLTLKGEVFSVSTETGEIKSVQLEFKHQEYKARFPSIAFLNGYVIVVGYLNTPKEMDECPNRLFLLTPDLKLEGFTNVELSGMVFCFLYKFRRIMLASESIIVASTLYHDKGNGDRSLLFFSTAKGNPTLVGRIDDCSEELITNFYVFENKIAVVGVNSTFRLIEYQT